jgi:hypothetical protein
MDPDMFGNYPGYTKGALDVLVTQEDGRQLVKTPNVAWVTQQHFNCSLIQGAELEDDGGQGTRGSHWEQRIFEVRSGCSLEWLGIQMYRFHHACHFSQRPRCYLANHPPLERTYHMCKQLHSCTYNSHEKALYIRRAFRCHCATK